MTTLLVNSPEILNLFRLSLPNFWYLEERSWFMKNSEIQLKLLLVIYLGLKNKILIESGDLSEHLDELIKEYFQNIKNRNKFLEKY